MTLIVKGFAQQEGIDYDETFAPTITIKLVTIKLVLALATHFD
jgi:hypothetical protein